MASRRSFRWLFAPEIFRDGGGTRTGVDQTLQGYTFTPEYDMAAKLSDIASFLRKLDGKFVVRGDVRLDRSNKNVFLTADPSLPVPQQFTAAVNLIYLF